MGTAVGAIFASVAFGISAIAVPMLLDRKVDVITTVSASVRAVNLNRPAMILWAVLIAGLIAMGFAALFAGLAIAFPLIGYATWHAYRELTGTEPYQAGFAGRANGSPPPSSRPSEREPGSQKGRRFNSLRSWIRPRLSRIRPLLTYMETPISAPQSRPS